jgi:hypothetical protein
MGCKHSTRVGRLTNIKGLGIIIKIPVEYIIIVATRTITTNININPIWLYEHEVAHRSFRFT